MHPDELVLDGLPQALHTLVLAGLQAYLTGVLGSQGQNIIQGLMLIIEERKDLTASVAHRQHGISHDAFLDLLVADVLRWRICVSANNQYIVDVGLKEGGLHTELFPVLTLGDGKQEGAEGTCHGTELSVVPSADDTLVQFDATRLYLTPQVDNGFLEDVLDESLTHEKRRSMGAEIAFQVAIAAFERTGVVAKHGFNQFFVSPIAHEGGWLLTALYASWVDKVTLVVTFFRIQTLWVYCRSASTISLMWRVPSRRNSLQKRSREMVKMTSIPSVTSCVMAMLS